MVIVIVCGVGAVMRPSVLYTDAVAKYLFQVHPVLLVQTEQKSRQHGQHHDGGCIGNAQCVSD